MGPAESEGRRLMRRLAIAFALGALSFPIASYADEVAEPDDAATGGADAGAPKAPAPATAPKASERSLPRRPDIAPSHAEAAPAAAESAGEGEEEEPGLLVAYLLSVKTRMLTGLNGIATAPADPVMATVNTPKAFAKAGYVRRPLGFASGCVLMAYRTFSGAVDLGFSAIPGLPVVSPVPRYKLIPGFEHEDE